MEIKNLTIGFIGAGFMGYGMAHNLLKKNYKLSVIAHINRKPIDKLISEGAHESKNLQEIAKNKCIIMCVSNTQVAKEIIKEILPHLTYDTLVIDITTHNELGSIEINNMLKKINICYVESPVMGGPVQSEQGILGAIVGCAKNDFKISKEILSSFCQNIFHFGEIGTASKAKLISNFLSLGTATFVIETLKAANHHNIDINKLYEVSKLGSGNSGALHRIADKAIMGDYKGYIFTVDNALKDFTYINDLLKDLPNAYKLSSLVRSFYKNASQKGNGSLLISELIKE
jgi:3-hydroxyisobutyrate dehydrogenase-like beta-hydroxyacid dehydrogenase